MKCDGCGTKKDVRIMRGKRILVPMCDACATQYPIVNGEGTEFRVIAVATERFTSQVGV
jgi:hypothetical protein